jgi:hypothetical protein
VFGVDESLTASINTQFIGPETAEKKTVVAGPPVK